MMMMMALLCNLIIRWDAGKWKKNFTEETDPGFLSIGDRFTYRFWYFNEKISDFQFPVTANTNLY